MIIMMMTIIMMIIVITIIRKPPMGLSFKKEAIPGVDDPFATGQVDGHSEELGIEVGWRLYHIILQDTILYHIISYNIMLYCIVLYYIVLYDIVVYYSVLPQAHIGEPCQRQGPRVRPGHEADAGGLEGTTSNSNTTTSD